MEKDIYIKSNERVKQFGEVFTPDKEVNDMMNLPGMKEESYNLHSTWLEPSCGTGNFLVEIIARKLKAAKILSDNGDDYDTCVVEAFCNTYGVDIQSDNVEESQSRMYDIFKEAYYDVKGEEPSSELCETIRFILIKNIVFGNMLTDMMIEQTYKKRRRTARSQKREFKVSMEESLNNDNIDKQTSMRFWRWSISDGKVYAQEFGGHSEFPLGSVFGGVGILKVPTMSPDM